jgi:hypothetical protein
MQKIINIRDLPEEEIRLIEDFINFLKARKGRKKEKKEKEDITFASWNLDVKGKLRREEIYE